MSKHDSRSGRCHTNVRRGTLFCLKEPPRTTTASQYTQLAPHPVFTPDSIAKKGYLYSTSQNTCLGTASSVVGETARFVCAARLVPGCAEGDYLPYTRLPDESPDIPPENLTSRGMCVLCQRLFAATYGIRLHISPFNCLGGYASTCIQKSTDATIALPIPEPMISHLKWVTKKTASGKLVRCVDEEVLWHVPDGVKAGTVIGRHAYELNRYAKINKLTRHPTRLYLEMFQQLDSVVVYLKRYFSGDNNIIAWLLTDLEQCTDIKLPPRNNLTPLLPWKPSSHRHLHELLGHRISFLHNMSVVLSQRLRSHSHDASAVLTRSLLSFVVQFLDANIKTAVEILRKREIVSPVDIRAFPEFAPKHQLVSHEQFICNILAVAKDKYPLNTFISAIRCILPISPKITGVHTQLSTMANNPSTPDAIVTHLLLLSVLLSNSMMHSSDVVEIHEVSLRMRHVILSMSLMDLLRLLQFDADNPKVHPHLVETTLRIAWLRLIAMPQQDGQIGIVSPAGFIGEYSGVVCDVRSELKALCQSYVHVQMRIEEWCVAQAQNPLPYGHFFDFERAPCFPDYTGVKLAQKRPTRSRPKASAKRKRDEDEESSVEDSLPSVSTWTPRRGASSVIVSLADLFNCLCVGGRRPSEHSPGEGFGRRHPRQTPMKSFNHLSVIELTNRIPSDCISIEVLKQLDISPQAISLLTNMVRNRQDEPLTVAEFDHVCKEILKVSPGEPMVAGVKRPRSVRGQKDISLLMLLINALRRDSPVRVQALHPSVGLEQTLFLESNYSAMFTGLRTLPVCPTCCAIVASPSDDNVAAAPTKLCIGKERSRGSREIRKQTVLASGCKTRRKNNSQKNHLPIDLDVESFLQTHMRRRCPLCTKFLCEEPGTYIDIVGRVIHGPLLHDRMHRRNITACQKCCSVTIASDSRRYGLGFLCTLCHATTGKIDTVCTKTFVSHPAQAAQTYILTHCNVGSEEGMSYKLSCEVCDGVQEPSQ